MTHEYTLLVGGIVRAGGATPVRRDPATALGYAHDTVLAVGSDAEVRSISRGDSRVVDLGGRRVEAPGGAGLEAGGPATFSIVDASGATIARVEEGRLVEGGLPGLA